MLAAAALVSALAFAASGASGATAATSAAWVAQQGSGAGGADPAPAPIQPPAPPLPRAPIGNPSPYSSNHVGVQARLAYRLADAGPSLVPAVGVSIGATFERRTLAFPESGFELGAALDLFYDRFATVVLGPTMNSGGVETTVEGQRVVSQTSFALLQTAALALGPRVRVWAGLGPGVSVGFLSWSEGDRPSRSDSAVQPLARGAAGVDVIVRGRAGFVVRADYSRVFTHPTFTTDAGTTYRLFGDLFDAGAGFLYRF